MKEQHERANESVVKMFLGTENSATEHPLPTQKFCATTSTSSIFGITTGPTWLPRLPNTKSTSSSVSARSNTLIENSDIKPPILVIDCTIMWDHAAWRWDTSCGIAQSTCGGSFTPLGACGNTNGQGDLFWNRNNTTGSDLLCPDSLWPCDPLWLRPTLAARPTLARHCQRSDQFFADNKNGEKSKQKQQRKENEHGAKEQKYRNKQYTENQWKDKTIFLFHFCVSGPVYLPCTLWRQSRMKEKAKWKKVPKWRNEHIMKEWTQNEGMNTEWRNEHRMKEWTQNEGMNTEWRNEHRMKEWTQNEGMNTEWRNEQQNEGMNNRMKEWTTEWRNEQQNARMNNRMQEWTTECKNEQQNARMNNRMQEWITECKKEHRMQERTQNERKWQFSTSILVGLRVWRQVRAESVVGNNFQMSTEEFPEGKPKLQIFSQSVVFFSSFSCCIFSLSYHHVSFFLFLCTLFDHFDNVFFLSFLLLRFRRKAPPPDPRSLDSENFA